VSFGVGNDERWVALQQLPLVFVGDRRHESPLEVVGVLKL
jgi:hypothetical protein